MEVKIYYLHKGDNIPFYIGKTINNLNKRKNQHSKKFNIKCEIELIDIINLDNWVFWEKHYISLYKSWGFNLINKNKGGSGPNFYNEEERKKFKVPKINKENYGKFQSKKVTQYDLDGNFIKTWPSANEAGRYFGKYTGSDINKCCKGYQKTAYGFIWKRFKQKHPIKIKIKDNFFRKTTKIIKQYDLEGNFIREWKSETLASEYFGSKCSNINQCLKKRQNTAHGYKWEYKEITKG